LKHSSIPFLPNVPPKIDHHAVEKLSLASFNLSVASMPMVM